MSQIYFSSDFHGYHKNICKGTTQWTNNANHNNNQECRDFPNEVAMTEHLVENINKCIKEDDILYFLGDWSFGGIDKIWKFRKQINCETIHFILGNHDHHQEANKEIYIPIEDNYILGKLDIPIDPFKKKDGKFCVEIRNLFSSVNHVLHTTIGKNKFFLSHYAHRVWNQSHHGVIHLYGHSHSSLEATPWGKSMDVGIDNAFKILGEYRPFHINEILEIMNKREIHIIDHHNQFTN